MVIEIDHEPGYRPFSSSVDLLIERLESVCDKPSGISVEYDEVDFGHEGTWSAQDVRDKAWEQKDTSPRDGTTLYWQILFPAGTYDSDSVLGVAVDASTVALFSDSIDEADGPFGRPSFLEARPSRRFLGIQSLSCSSQRRPALSPSFALPCPSHSNLHF